MRIRLCRAASVADTPGVLVEKTVETCSDSSECMLIEPVWNGICRPVCVLVIFMRPVVVRASDAPALGVLSKAS